MIDIIWIAIIIYSFLCMMGWPLGLLILPSQLQKYQLWLAPWLGITAVGISSVWLSRFGFGTEISLYFTLLIGISGIGICRFRKITLLPSFTVEDVLMGASVLFSLGLVLLPLVTVEGFPTTISIGNNDAQNYALLGDFLKTHGLYQKPTAIDVQPNAYAIADLLGPGIRPSCWLLYSILSSLVQRRTHEIFTIGLGIFFALTPPLIAIFTKIVSKNKFAAAIALLISTLNVNFLYFNYHGFGAQIPSQGILIFGFILLYLIDLRSIKYREFIFPIAVITSTLFTLYVEIIPFFVLPALMYGGSVIYSQFRENSSDTKKCFQRIMIVIIASIMIDPIAVVEGLNWLSRTSNLNAGWPMSRWALPSDMLGFFSIYPETPNLPGFWPRIMSIPIVVCTLVGARSTKNRDFTIAYLVFSIGILIYLRYVRVYSYGYHKAIVFSLAFLIVLFASGLAIILQKAALNFKRRSSQLKISQIAITASLLPILANGIVPMVTVMNQKHFAVDRNLSELSQIKVDLNREIYLSETRMWEQMWMTHFLGDRPIRFPVNSPYYGHGKFVRSTVPFQSLYLTGIKKPLIAEKKEDFAKNIWTNSVYRLKETQNLIDVTPGQNWHLIEKSWVPSTLSDEFCWLNQDATLKIFNNSVTMSVAEVELKLVTLLPQTTVEFYVDDRLLATHRIQSLKSYQLSIPLTEKEVTLKIHVQEGAIIPPNDVRSIALGISSVRFTSR